MPRQEIHDPNAGPPMGAYSQGIRAGDFIYITGTTPMDPRTGTIDATTVAGQTEQVIRNIESVLGAGGATLDDVVKSTVHLLDVSTFAEFDQVYRQRFSAPYPVRTTVGSDMRQVPNMLVEIDCVAYVGP